jgi:hypothetical protein
MTIPLAKARGFERIGKNRIVFTTIRLITWSNPMKKEYSRQDVRKYTNLTQNKATSPCVLQISLIILLWEYFFFVEFLNFFYLVYILV